ncbi:MAG: zinc ribbon domain-containing protein [Lachnospiraceae bacterium]|nr:zinc ribbon domain-containing protein [Lachnospiraceae bacterium]
MDFFDNLSEMISSKGKEAKEVAKKVAEIANLKGKISGLETEVKKNYRKIGEAYYEAYKAAEVTCEFEEYVQAIRDAKKSIEELTFKLNELKGDLECKGCGSQIKAGSAFCPNCGTKVEVEYFDDEDEIVEEAEEASDEVEELEEVVEDIVE